MHKDSLAREIGWLLKEKYKGELTPAAKRDITLLKREEHVDYVIGFVEFAGCTIDLSKRPFIPRPETEYWVMQIIHRLAKEQPLQIRCLDMFAGSGCIGIAVLKACPELCRRADFAEKNKKFLEQIEINTERNDIAADRYGLLQSDIWSGVAGSYDFIFANPPYCAEKRIGDIQQSVLDWEPKEAVLAGPDGLQYIREFLKGAKNHLHPGGRIYMEFYSFQKSQIAEIVRSHDFRNAEFFKDQYGKWRFVVIQ